MRTSASSSRRSPRRTRAPDEIVSSTAARPTERSAGCVRRATRSRCSRSRARTSRAAATSRSPPRRTTRSRLPTPTAPTPPGGSMRSWRRSRPAPTSRWVGRSRSIGSLLDACVASLGFPLAATEVDEASFMPSARSVAFRREAIDAVGGYPEWLAIGEDMWVNHRWRERGFAMRMAPEARGVVAPARLAGRDWTQYVRYARGDGRAGMYPERHALRFAVYGGPRCGARVAPDAGPSCSRSGPPSRTRATPGHTRARPLDRAARPRDGGGRGPGTPRVHGRREDVRLRARPRGPADRPRPTPSAQ